VKFAYVIVIAAAVISVRLAIGRNRRGRRAAGDRATGTAGGTGATGGPRFGLAGRSGLARIRPALEGSLGDVGLIAMREIRERVRGRIFRVGTLFMLLAVGAAIVIPTLHGSSGPTRQTVGYVGGLSPGGREVVQVSGLRSDDSVKLKPEPSLRAAKADLRSSKVDFVIVDGDRILLNLPASSSRSPADPGLVQDVAEYLGVLRAYQAAGLTAAQATLVDRAKPVPVQALQRASTATTKLTSVIGLVLLFFMLTQYNTWILIGVMQEKASRVVEVLLSTVRPIQLLGGKVLGIGLVALGQATLVVGFALVVATGVGSDLLHGTAPLVVACELLWLVLGYAFYCWVYAAAGSMAERQDQVQTLALPLSIPILLAYVFSITVASSGSPDLFFKVLAYLPPTAPFCMSVLVGLSQVTWWQFVASVLVTVVGTVGMAVFAARIYRRAVLRTGARVRVRELFARTAH
jgi:ABC-2 type transport system permease protein